MAQCLFRSFRNNVTRVAISSYKNVDYDVKPAKMRFTSHENLLVHPLLLPVSSQREQTIVLPSYSLLKGFSQYITIIILNPPETESNLSKAILFLGH